MCEASVSATTATSARSSASISGSVTPFSHKATSPASTASSRKLSLTFCANQLARTMVQSAPLSCNAGSARCTSSSPRPESSTIRRTPTAGAVSVNERTASTASGTARSG